jgi:hypothetical protein
MALIRCCEALSHGLRKCDQKRQLILRSQSASRALDDREVSMRGRRYQIGSILCSSAAQMSDAEPKHP